MKGSVPSSWEMASDSSSSPATFSWSPGPSGLLFDFTRRPSLKYGQHQVRWGVLARAAPSCERRRRLYRSLREPAVGPVDYRTTRLVTAPIAQLPCSTSHVWPWSRFHSASSSPCPMAADRRSPSVSKWAARASVAAWSISWSTDAASSKYPDSSSNRCPLSRTCAKDQET